MSDVMLVNFAFCTGCHSCEVSCRKEKGLPLDEWGIQVQQIGPDKLGDVWEFDYVPVPSRLCDLCTDRRAEGNKALCELHCLANVIEILPAEQAAERMVQLGSKTSCFIP